MFHFLRRLKAESHEIAKQKQLEFSEEAVLTEQYLECIIYFVIEKL